MTTRNTSSTIANIFHVSSDANTGNNNIDSDALEMALRRMKIISARQLLVDITPAILWRDSNDLRTKLLILHILQIAAGVSDADVLTTRRLFASECNGLLDRDTQILVHQNVVAMTDTLRKQIAWDLDCVAAVRQRGQEILAFSGSSMQPAQRQQLFDAMLETALDAANSNISSQAPVAFDISAPLFTGTDNISSMGPSRNAPFQGQPQCQPHGPDHRKSFTPSQLIRQLSSLLESGQSFQLLGSLSTHPNSQGLLHFLSTSNGNNYSPSTHNNIGLSDICNPNESTPTTIDASNQSSLNLFLSQIQERHLQPQLNGNLPFALADSGQNLNQARQNEHQTELGQLRNLYSILQSSPALVLDILRAESNSNLSLGSTVDLQFQLQQHLSGQVQMQEGRFRSGSEQSLRLPQQLLQELLVGKRAVERNSNLGDEEVSSNHGGGEVGVPRREQGQSQEEGRGSTDGGANHLQRQDYEDLDEEEDISDEEGASTNVPMQVVENTKDHASRWRRRYEELLQYRAEFGDCLVPQRYERNPKLGTWVRTQRRHYKLMSDGKQSSMRMDRLRKLSDIGFVWSVR